MTTRNRLPSGFVTEDTYWASMVKDVSAFRQRFLQTLKNFDIEKIAKELGYTTRTLMKELDSMQRGRVLPLPVLVEEISRLTNTGIDYLFMRSDNNDPSNVVPKGDWSFVRPRFIRERAIGISNSYKRRNPRRELTQKVLALIDQANASGISYSDIASATNTTNIKGNMDAYREGRVMHSGTARKFIYAINELLGTPIDIEKEKEVQEEVKEKPLEEKVKKYNSRSVKGLKKRVSKAKYKLEENFWDLATQMLNEPYDPNLIKPLMMIADSNFCLETMGNNVNYLVVGYDSAGLGFIGPGRGRNSRIEWILDEDFDSKYEAEYEWLNPNASVRLLQDDKTIGNILVHDSYRTLTSPMLADRFTVINREQYQRILSKQNLVE